jgi:hypothetical protein
MMIHSHMVMIVFDMLPSQCGILEVLGSNPDTETGYPDLEFFLSPCSQMQCQGITLN